MWERTPNCVRVCDEGTRKNTRNEVEGFVFVSVGIYRLRVLSPKALIPEPALSAHPLLECEIFRTINATLFPSQYFFEIWMPHANGNESAERLNNVTKKSFIATYSL